MPRFEIDALVVVDAETEEEAIAKARKLSDTLNAEEGPGAFFYGIGIAPLEEEIAELDDDHEAAHLAALPVAEHVTHIRA